MRASRASVLLLAGLMAACAPADEQAMADPAAEVSPDEAALEQLRSDYVTHYNLHHADMVADLFVDSAFFLAADQSVLEGAPAIEASLAAEFAGSPVLDITTGGTIVAGDNAVAHGTYSVTTTPEGGSPMSMAGSYLTVFQRVAGAWKIRGVISNLSSPAPEGFPWAESPAEPPPENGTMGEILTAYTNAFNAGDAAAAAALFTEDAEYGFAGRPGVSGRAGIEAVLAERIAASSARKLEMHDVGTLQLGEGWAVDGGWYRIELTAEQGPMVQSGMYMTLLRQQADGSWKVHRGVSNGKTEPATM